MKLLERVAAVGARRRLAASTVNCYVAWAGDFLRFCRGGADGRWRHPRDLGAADVERFLTYLARERHLSASSQNQALNAVVFLYKQVLADELPAGHLGRFEAERSRRPVRVPTVLSAAEVERLIAAMEAASAARLMVELMYGTGLRVAECCTLRVRDVDFDRRQVVVRGGKGDKDRLVMLPDRCGAALADQARRVRHRHARDVERGGGYAPLPDALANKAPYAGRDWRWQFLFPSATLRRHPRGKLSRIPSAPRGAGEDRMSPLDATPILRARAVVVMDYLAWRGGKFMADAPAVAELARRGVPAEGGGGCGGRPGKSTGPFEGVPGARGSRHVAPAGVNHEFLRGAAAHRQATEAEAVLRPRSFPGSTVRRP